MQKQAGSDALFDDWVDYNALELVRGTDRFPLRKGNKGFAMITVRGEVTETLVPNATLEAAEKGKALGAAEARQAHPKGGARKRPAAASKKPGCAVADSDDEERDSSSEDELPDGEDAAIGAGLRRPAAAGAGEGGLAVEGGAGAEPPPEPRPPASAAGGSYTEKAWSVMWYKRDKAAALRQVHKPGRQITQWAAGGRYTEEQMREMATDMVSRLSMGEITEGEVRAKGLEYLRNMF